MLILFGLCFLIAKEFCSFEYSELQSPSKMENIISNLGGSKEPIRIKAFECFTKVQEARPVHRSNLVNKQLGYDAIIQINGETDSVKVKNCITSARSNSQLFKRFSRTLIRNIKNDVDQLILFTSLNSLTRLETSIGLPTNPGVFLIIGLTYLDEKYKEAYQKCDIEFSFLQFRDGQMFDLLCFTGQPLVPQKESSDSGDVNFKEYWVRATTFNQFIKLFKVALFNNGERDFKSDGWNGKSKSTFIMKVRNKLYSEQGDLLRSQETVLIDFQPNCMKESAAYLKQKAGSKTIWDYILIEMHNSNPSNKHIHYHMVEQNHFLQLFKKFLGTNREKDQKQVSVGKRDDKQASVGGQIIIVNSIPADKESFASCFAYYNSIVNAIGQSWQAKVIAKPKQIKQFDHAYVETQLGSIVDGVAVNTYSSLRNFHQFKHNIIAEVKKCKSVIREFRRAINASMKEKVELIFLKNELMAHAVKLIGSCIKSDHFKDFYNAKSYIQLEREVSIKTESIKEEIRNKMKMQEDAERKFYALKRKEIENFERYNLQKEDKKDKGLECILQSSMNWTNTTYFQQSNKQNLTGTRAYDNKFKKINFILGEERQMDQLRHLVNYMSEYMYSVWDNYVLFDQRTVMNSIEFEQLIAGEEALVVQMLNKFVGELEGIKQTEIMYEQDNNIHNNNDVGLFRSLNFLGLIGPKKVVKGCEIGKRLLITTENKNKCKQRSSVGKMECGKLPSIGRITPIVIDGNLKISQMLSNPTMPEISKQGSLILDRQ